MIHARAAYLERDGRGDYASEPGCDGRCMPRVAGQPGTGRAQCRLGQVGRDGVGPEARPSKHAGHAFADGTGMMDLARDSFRGIGPGRFERLRAFAALGRYLRRAHGSAADSSACDFAQNVLDKLGRCGQHDRFERGREGGRGVPMTQRPRPKAARPTSSMGAGPSGTLPESQ